MGVRVRALVCCAWCSEAKFGEFSGREWEHYTSRRVVVSVNDVMGSSVSRDWAQNWMESQIRKDFVVLMHWLAQICTCDSLPWKM